MATADELIMKLIGEDYHEDLQFIIDENLRTIAIQKDGVVLGVCGDKDINRVNFRMNRYYNGFDMSVFNIRINYINANGEPNYFVVDDIEVTEEYLIFTWLVDSYAVMYKGAVRFCIRMYLEESGAIDKQFFTTIGTALVLEGIYVDNYIPEGVVIDLVTRIASEVEAKIQAKADAALASIPEDYTALTNEVSELKEDIGAYNLVNTAELIEGYINFTDGLVYTNVSDFHCTDFIEIRWLKKIRVKRTFHYGADGLAFYDKHKNYISGYAEQTGSNYVVLDVPENAVYTRLSGFSYETLEVYPNDVWKILNKHSNELLELKELKGGNILESQIKETIISDLENISLGGGMFEQDGKIVVNYPAGGGNEWWTVPVILEKTKNNIVNLHFEITDLAEGNSVTIYKSFTSTDGQVKYILIKNIAENGIYDIPFDVNYSIVYEGLDTTKGIYMLGANGSSPCSYTCINPILYDVSTLLDTEKNLGENLNTMVEDISSNKNDIIALKSKISGVMVSPNGSQFLMQVSDNGEIVAVPKIPSNILYVGNSLLLGFGTFGMAASNSNEDYYHYVNEYLTSLGKVLSTDRLQGSGYEGTTSSDEQDTWLNTYLLPKLNNSLQLVIIQLGDNVNTEERIYAFEEGAKKLIRFIRKYAPNTRVAWVGEWYSSSIKQTYISNACVECGATFIDISKLPNVSGNQSYVGAKYVTDDGVEHEITNSGVASHPSSQGMRQIADIIIDVLFK